MSEPSRRDLRAADADRDRVAAALRAHCLEGRLSMAELSERLAATYDARTLGQLAELTADLPELDEHPLPVPAHSGAPVATLPAEVNAGRSGGSDRSGRSAGVGLRSDVLRWLTVSVVCVVIWAGTGFGAYFWPFWVIAPWGAILAARAAAGRFGSSRPPDVH